MLHIIKDSLQQVANTYKLKSRENGPDTVSPSFPGDKNNEARTRRFQKLLARRLFWGTAVYHSPLKFQYAQLGPFDVCADPETSRVNMNWYKEGTGTSGSLRPSPHPQDPKDSPHTYKLNDKWTLTYGKHLRFYRFYQQLMESLPPQRSQLWREKRSPFVCLLHESFLWVPLTSEPSAWVTPHTAFSEQNIFFYVLALCYCLTVVCGAPFCWQGLLWGQGTALDVSLASYTAEGCQAQQILEKRKRIPGPGGLPQPDSLLTLRSLWETNNKANTPPHRGLFCQHPTAHPERTKVLQDLTSSLPGVKKQKCSKRWKRMAVPLLGRLWPLSPHLLTGVTPEFSPSSLCGLSRVSHGILFEYTIALEGLQVYSPNALDIQTSAVICLLMLSLSRLSRKKTIGWKLGLSWHPTAFHTIQRNTLSKVRSYTHLSPGWLKSNSIALDEKNVTFQGCCQIWKY